MKPETLTTVISVMGIILTTASVVASVAQYQAADLQAKAAVVALMPQIEVRTLLEKVDSDKFTDRSIEITSDGGPVRNLQIDHVTWIEFHVSNKVVLREALNGYYFAGYSTGRARGAVYTLKGYKNNEIYSTFQDWAKPVLHRWVEVASPTTILRIAYRDALKRDNVEFVQVAGGTVTQLSDLDGQQIWQAKPPKALEPRLLDINDLQTPDKAAMWVKAWQPVLQKALNGS